MSPKPRIMESPIVYLPQLDDINDEISAEKKEAEAKSAKCKDPIIVDPKQPTKKLVKRFTTRLSGGLVLQPPACSNCGKDAEAPKTRFLFRDKTVTICSDRCYILSEEVAELFGKQYEPQVGEKRRFSHTNLESGGRV